MARATRVALYLRVSTSDQATENQLRELTAAADRHCWEVIHVFNDSAVSGANARDRRPAFDQLCHAIARREVDMVAAWSVDRLGRSLRDLVTFLEDLHSKKVDLYLHQQGLDTSTPTGKAMFQLIGVFAEFERALIVERVKSGLSRARANGKRLGRPKIAAAKELRVRQLLSKGSGVLKTAKTVGVGVSAVQRIKLTVV